MHGSPLAGGSQVVQRGVLPREAALGGSFAAVLLALGVGIVLQFGYTQDLGPCSGSSDLWVVSFTRRSRRRKVPRHGLYRLLRPLGLGNDDRV